MSKCLVVDDSELNLEMSVEVLKAFEIDASGALSGDEAINCLSVENEIVLVLMDYRMPGENGAEVTKRIRSLEESGDVLNQNNKPLIILGMSGDIDEATNQAFIDAGANGIIGKPLDFGKLKETLDKVAFSLDNLRFEPMADDASDCMPANKNNSSEPFGSSEPFEIEESSEIILSNIFDSSLFFDEKQGLMYAKNKEKYIEFLVSFANNGKTKQDEILNYLEKGDIRTFTIEVHSLKSNSRFLGNNRLSELSAKLENAGDKKDFDLINQIIPEFVEVYSESIAEIEDQIINRIINSDKDNHKCKKAFVGAEIKEILEYLSEVLDSFDIDAADNCVKELSNYDWPEDLLESFNILKKEINDINYEDAIKESNDLWRRI